MFYAKKLQHGNCFLCALLARSVMVSLTVSFSHFFVSFFSRILTGSSGFVSPTTRPCPLFYYTDLSLFLLFASFSGPSIFFGHIYGCVYICMVIVERPFFVYVIFIFNKDFIYTDKKKPLILARTSFLNLFIHLWIKKRSRLFFLQIFQNNRIFSSFVGINSAPFSSCFHELLSVHTIGNFSFLIVECCFFKSTYKNSSVQFFWRKLKMPSRTIKSRTGISFRNSLVSFFE